MGNEIVSVFMTDCWRENILKGTFPSLQEILLLLLTLEIVVVAIAVKFFGYLFLGQSEAVAPSEAEPIKALFSTVINVMAKWLYIQATAF